MNIVLSLLLALQSVHHAYACTKDQCYKQVAGSISGSPADSVRKADCSAALRTVVVDDLTSTVTSYETVPAVTSTLTVTDATTTKLSISTVSQIDTFISTRLATITRTSTTIEVATSTGLAAKATICSSDETTTCGSCSCFVSTSSDIRVCARSRGLCSPCLTDLDCSGSLSKCVYSPASDPCGKGTRMCVAETDCPVLSARGARHLDLPNDPRVESRILLGDVKNLQVQSESVFGVGGSDGNRLEARDRIIVAGSTPSYANACKSTQEFGVACLCYGVRAKTYKAGKTVTVKVTVTPTAFSSVYATRTASVLSFRSVTRTTVTTRLETSTAIKNATRTSTTQVTLQTGIVDLASGYNLKYLEEGRIMKNTDNPPKPAIELRFGNDTQPYRRSKPTDKVMIACIAPNFGTFVFPGLAQHYGRVGPVYCSVGAGGFLKCRARCPGFDGTEGTEYSQFLVDCFGPSDYLYLGVPGTTDNGCLASDWKVPPNMIPR